jgi:DNA-binding transcriptional LysR family regulator
VLNDTFPDLMVASSTEGLGGSLRRLRGGTAALAICLLLPDVPDDIVAFPLMRVRLQAVVARDHPLASLGRAADREDLAPHVQLVLSDPVDPGSPDYGLAGERRWRFVDLGRRLDFLLAGFGWCRMPTHLIEHALAAGQLVPIDIADDPTPVSGLTIYAAHLRDREPGMAGRWLLDDLRSRLADDGLG